MSDVNAVGGIDKVTGTYITQICIGGMDLRTVVFFEGHAPETVVLALAGSPELLPESVGSLEQRM